ncbi:MULTISPECIES: MFS transporter [Providencia]|uniref:MFS transporter n=1 Tax=Providencia TaxID=586 RepID=UPI001B37FB58|nr:MULTISPECIES: MFS transporter [Providencia]EJD6477717.1 MFS transporter [Providencia rettgeri]EMB5784711.1 MFS transporter [Providencia rettgeri]MBQ0343383.1 MFS transporter [Providencia rettgeri]MDH2371822.1 MFS transporter [Providencia rettgeri]
MSQKETKDIFFSNTLNERKLSPAKWSTRIAFFIAGFSLSCWAPLVPYAQQRIHADSAMLGTILLCLGLGAVIGMPTAGSLAGKVGSKKIIIAGVCGLFIALPLLASVSTPVTLGLTLLLFGASIGATDVAANIHGTEVQNIAGTPLMSGFHGFYSIGGLAGASFITLLIVSGLDIRIAASTGALLVLISIFLTAKGFLSTLSTETLPLFVVPKGKVIGIGVLAMVIFLAEGAMLDWGAIFLIQVKNVSEGFAGTGYVVFAIAMALSRFIGDRVVTIMGEKAMILCGVLFTAVGIFLMTVFSSFEWVLAAMALAGLAAGNVVPVLFSLAGRQKSMPATLAISAASILGYLGVLMGPALIGYAAHFIGLTATFISLGVIVALSASIVTMVMSKKVNS